MYEQAEDTLTLFWPIVSQALLSCYLTGLGDSTGFLSFANRGLDSNQENGASAPSSLINGVVPVGWGEAHLSQIHVECLYSESSIAFHTQ